VRLEVMAVVHSHSPSVIPFGVTRTKLRPVYHMGSFLWSGVPVFDIRKVREENDLLVRDRPLGQALVKSLGACTCVLMRGHGMIGRKYAGKVTQIISGSVGLDDWEWGVSLFADDPLVFKKLIYEMRFDPASALYALFGAFYVGIRLQPSDLGAWLAGTLQA
jgi:hypothetical protein